MEILVLCGLFSNWGMGISLKEAGIPLGSASVKIFNCTGRFWNFGHFSCIWILGDLWESLEMNICIFLVRARENQVD